MAEPRRVRPSSFRVGGGDGPAVRRLLQPGGHRWLAAPITTTERPGQSTCHTQPLSEGSGVAMRGLKKEKCGTKRKTQNSTSVVLCGHTRLREQRPRVDNRSRHWSEDLQVSFGHQTVMTCVIVTAHTVRVRVALCVRACGRHTSE